MPPYTIEELKAGVTTAVAQFNRPGNRPQKISKVSLFGSYAEGCANASSDVDLLIAFDSSGVSLITLADVLSTMESNLGIPVDIVQDPLPTDSLLEIKTVVPLYE